MKMRQGKEPPWATKVVDLAVVYSGPSMLTDTCEAVSSLTYPSDKKVLL